MGLFVMEDDIVSEVFLAIHRMGIKAEDVCLYTLEEYYQYRECASFGYYPAPTPTPTPNSYTHSRYVWNRSRCPMPSENNLHRKSKTVLKYTRIFYVR